jgi:tRNA(Glu) U13 pseudouridine synthase TruD
VRAVLARAHATPSQYADELRHRFARDLAGWQRAPRDLEAWVWETHRVGVDVAYGRLPRAIPHERGSIADCREHDGVGERMARLDVRLGDAYVEAVRSTVDAQLAKAAARLASILDAAFR